MLRAPKLPLRMMRAFLLSQGPNAHSSASTPLRKVVRQRGRARPSNKKVCVLGPGAREVLSASNWKPASVIIMSIGRFRWQPPAMRVQSGSSRSCQRATPGSGARPCSTNSRAPPGRSARRTSASARPASEIVQSDHVLTTVSTLLLSSVSASADPCTSLTGKRPPAAAPAAFASSAEDGSMPTTSLTPEP